MSRSAERAVYGADTIGGRINGAFMSVRISTRRGLIHSNRPFGSRVSPWVSSSQSRTALVFIPLSHKKQVVRHPSSCRHILRDQPLTGITYVLLKKALILLSAALSPFSLSSLHLPAIVRPRPLVLPWTAIYYPSG